MNGGIPQQVLVRREGVTVGLAPLTVANAALCLLAAGLHLGERIPLGFATLSVAELRRGPRTGSVGSWRAAATWSSPDCPAAHLSTHVFDADRQRSGLLATRSTDGRRTWSRAATLAMQSGSRDGESAGGAIAADPADPRQGS